MTKLYEHTSHEDKCSTHCEFIKYNNRTFKIYVEISNGDCIGFNRKCCLSCMTPNGDFVEVVDNREIGIPYSNRYECSSYWREDIINQSINGFKDFIKKIY